jgi:CubicO group peptidase (beta-lactamase class C family)
MRRSALHQTYALLILLIAAVGCVSSSSVATSSPAVRQQVAPAQFPDTTLGRIMQQLLDVVDRGEPGEIERFVESNFSMNAFRSQPASEYVAFLRKLQQQSGGLEIVSVTPDNTAQPMTVLARSRIGGHFVRVQAGLDHAEPQKLAGMGADKATDPDAPKLADVSGPLSEAEMIAAIRTDLERRAAAGDLSGVVLIAKGDEVLLEEAYGYADREAKRPNTIDTTFHIASVGKMFTAVSIAQLVNAGKLSYSDTVASVLPEYPNREVASKITIHQLLTHSAGLGTFFGSPGFVPGKTYLNSSEEIAVYQDEKLFFEPGWRWRYSNASFSLLGAIIEKLSGKSYIDYIRENIFDPLGMRKTYASPDDASVFYTQSPRDPLGLEPYMGDRALVTGKPSGFGGGFSSARDLFTFLRAYRTGRLMGEGMTLVVAEGKVNQDASGARRAGYGIFEYETAGQVVRGHTGGSRVEVEMLWNSDYTVIVMLNAIPPPVNVVASDIVSFIAANCGSGSKCHPERSEERAAF